MILLLPDRDTEGEGGGTTRDDAFAPLKCAHVLAFKMTPSRPHVVCVRPSGCDCVYCRVAFFYRISAYVLD